MHSISLSARAAPAVALLVAALGGLDGAWTPSASALLGLATVGLVVALVTIVALVTVHRPHYGKVQSAVEFEASKRAHTVRLFLYVFIAFVWVVALIRTGVYLRHDAYVVDAPLLHALVGDALLALFAPVGSLLVHAALA